MTIAFRNIACSLIVAFTALPSVHATSAIHWINDSNQPIGSVLNGGPFITSFRTSNDVTVSELSGFTSGHFVDIFAGPTPANNPDYVTTFVGSTSNGTGSGTAGQVAFLNMAATATGSLQFDFAQPLTPADRLLFVDIDSNEQYHIEAFSLVSSTYVPLSLLGWTYATFSGQAGVAPDSRWPSWDAANGLLTATSSALNEELSVLTPNQLVSRLVISKTTGAGASTGFQTIEVATLAGDYNGNGIVDAADYTVWRDHLGQNIVLPDDTTPGSVTQADYSVWKSNFGNHSDSGSGNSSAVPEPASLMLLLSGTVAFCSGRCQKGRKPTNV